MKVQRLWRDDTGKVVLWQRPNIWLSIWAATVIARLFALPNDTVLILRAIGFAVLIIWALLELLQGVNYFRRALGLVVLVLTITSIFNIRL